MKNAHIKSVLSLLRGALFISTFVANFCVWINIQTSFFSQCSVPVILSQVWRTEMMVHCIKFYTKLTSQLCFSIRWIFILALSGSIFCDVKTNTCRVCVRYWDFYCLIKSWLPNSCVKLMVRRFVVKTFAGQSLIMAALCNRAVHYIFALWFLLSIYLSIYLSSIYFFSSPNLSRRRLDVYHTSTHGVALVRIQDAGLKHAACGSLKMQDPKSRQKFAICAPSHNFVGLYLHN